MLFTCCRNYGYAAARAYTAYKDPAFLDLAVTSWTTARRYTISKEQAALGTTGVKQFNISSCQGALAGGTYWTTDSDEPTVAGIASGFFLTLSALLAEGTSNQTYLDAAIESANFIQSHLLNPSNVVLDSVSSMSNESCPVNSTVHSYNSGIFIEGLVILADITRSASTESLLRSTIVAVAADTQWQGLDGIIATIDNGGHYIVRALAALYERNTTTSDLREYIKEYIAVQYNAVIEHATSGGNNIYGLPWTGPPGTWFSSYNQTVAVSALLSGIQIADGQSSSSSSDNPTSTRSAIPTGSTTTFPVAQKKNPTGTIVGGVMGGLVALVVILAGVLHLHRRRSHTPLVDERSPQILTPFMDTSTRGEISGQPHINRGKMARYTVPETRGESPGADVGARRVDVQIESTIPVAAVSPPNPLHTERRDDMPTEQLLRLLNQRLQPGRWTDLDDELPPEYHEGRTA
ncbi:hypothetical protein ARMGADRAFT_542026 [Armillaria gallica]|uniref:Glycoside hydrolase family 76 protein n=1 Tax=Armillaria gallica TaxID=47427 RepID=A0A2H3CSL4_ARMGA|nr:hypothetical protein ARMGADRAFT_542026 [Armillaria gallica]